ncbi:yippee family protein [Seiridium cupressi]
MANDMDRIGPAPRFPVYLLPSFSIPFRRRRQSFISNISSGNPPNETLVPSLGSSPTDSMLSSPIESPPTPSYLTSRFSFSRAAHQVAVTPLDVTKLMQIQPDIIRCSTCSTDLAFTSQIVSKGFTGRYGRAYLVSPPDYAIARKSNADLINIRVGRPETRLLVTGSHVVADITCAICHAKVGWKYVDAKEETQRYKVGKFILETARVMDHRSWEDVTVSETPDLSETNDKRADGGEPIVFDSEDEDECEDVFSGTWDPEVVAKRRTKKVNKRPKQTG